MNQRLNTRATGLTRSLIAAALLATTGLAAQAHQVWLEHSGSQAKLHFGEYNDNVRETSPGLLDKFKGVPVLEQTVAGATQRVEGLLTKEAFTYTAAANAANTLKVGGWNRLDLGVRYLTEVQGKLVTLRLRIDNVADKNYWASVGGYPGSGYLTVSAPRTVSLSASVDF